jgi:quinol-cytochrome oxidoreductase complex cytochrome b subunit
VSARRPAAAVVLDTVAATLLGLVAVSGFALAFHYVPSAELAWDSIRAFERDVPAGAWLRALHVQGASWSIAAVLALMLREALAADWPGTRIRWFWSLCVAGAVVAAGLTGELLPWTQQAVYATTVRVGIAGEAPIVGPLLRDAALGGRDVGAIALLRFHVLHVLVIPAGLAALLWWHRRLAARERASTRTGPTIAALVAALAGCALVYVAARAPAALGAVHVAGDPFEPVPEWHFVWLNTLLRLVPSTIEPLVAVGLPGALAAAAVAASFVATNPSRRRIWRAAVLVAVVGLLALTGVGLTAAPPDNDARPVPPLEADADVREGYRILRRERCLDCHELGEYGREQFGAPRFEDLGHDFPVEDFIDIVRDPAGALGTLDMPAYDHLDDLELRKLAKYVRSIQPAPPDRTATRSR